MTVVVDPEYPLGAAASAGPCGRPDRVVDKQTPPVTYPPPSSVSAPGT